MTQEVNTFDLARSLSLDDIEATLRRHHARKCAFCDQATFHVLPDPKEDNKPAEFQFQIKSQKMMPCFGVACANCGNTLFLSMTAAWKLHNTRTEGENNG